MQPDILHLALNASSIARLETQHHAIRFLLAGMAVPLLVKRPESGAWSIAEQVAHLGRYQEVFCERIDLMLSVDAPAFERYNADRDAGFTAWASRDPLEMLDAMDAGRADLVRLVQGLTSVQLARTASHPLFGTMSIPLWVEFLLLHEAHHIYAIMKLRGAFEKGL